MVNSKIIKLISGGMLGISAILGIAFFSGWVREAIIINWSYFLILVATLVATLFPLVYMIKNPKKAKITLLGISSLIVLFLISYALSTGVEYVEPSGKVLASAKESLLSEAGLNLFYILGVIAIGAIIYTEVSKAIK